jgi:inhibitor of Bruton tyrosine kinase
MFKVLSCGSNEHFQLGQSGNPPPKYLLYPRCLGMKNLPLKKVLGICAGRFHSVLWSERGVATCGLNAGQLGHVNQNKEPMIMTPKLVIKY